MNRIVWRNRVAAAGALVLGLVALTSAVSAVGDLLAVRAAGAGLGAAPAAAFTAPAGLRPVVRRTNADSKVAIDEYLNVRLGALGLGVSAVEVVQVSPIGHGLQLAEVQVRGRGGPAAAAAAANWAAINREAVRVKSMTVTVDPSGQDICTLVLLMVIA